MTIATARAAFGLLAQELLGPTTALGSTDEATNRIEARLSDASAPMAYVIFGCRARRAPGGR